MDCRNKFSLLSKRLSYRPGASLSVVFMRWIWFAYLSLSAVSQWLTEPTALLSTVCLIYSLHSYAIFGIQRYILLAYILISLTFFTFSLHSLHSPYTPYISLTFPRYSYSNYESPYHSLPIAPSSFYQAYWILQY